MWQKLSKLSDGSKEFGGSRNAYRSLNMDLKKLLVNAGKDIPKSLAKSFFFVVYHVGGTSLGLDQRSSSLDNL